MTDFRTSNGASRTLNGSLMNRDSDKIFRECGPGWNKIVDPLVKRCTELGGSVQQIKEKFAQLRFYYYPGDPGTEKQWDDFEDAVRLAEAESARTCEMCGSAGIVMSNGGWVKTVCKDHAIELGYHTRSEL